MRYPATQEVLHTHAGDITCTYTGTEIQTMAKVVGGETYLRSFTWTGGNLTHITDWIMQ